MSISLSSFPLAGRTAIVTGAGGGIGRAIAVQLSSAGAHVFLAGRREAPLIESQQKILDLGGKASYVTLDVRDPQAIADLVNQAVRSTGKLNIMVNNAGLAYREPILEGNPEQWREMFETNVIAALNGSQAAARAMRAMRCAGHIVNIGSNSARREGSGVYGATKAALNVIGATLRKELEGEPIRVVQVLPGPVLTNFDRHYPPEVVNELLRVAGEEPSYQKGDLLSDAQIEPLQTAAAPYYVKAEDVGRVVLFAVTQPIEVDVFEIVIRPARDFSQALQAGRS